MLGQSECSCLHKAVNMVVFFVKSNSNTYPKERALMQMYRVVPITKRGNVDETVYSIIYRTAFFVLGLVACTREGAVLLSQYGWESRWSTRTECWPLVEDHAALLEDMVEEFQSGTEFETSRYELGSPISNLDFIAEEQFQLGMPGRNNRRQVNSDDDDDDDDDVESGIHMGCKPQFQTYNQDSRHSGVRLKSRTLPLPSYNRAPAMPHRAHTVRSVALADQVKDRTRSAEHISMAKDFHISREQRSQSVNLGVKHKVESVINNNIYSALDKNSVEKKLSAAEPTPIVEHSVTKAQNRPPDESVNAGLTEQAEAAENSTASDTTSSDKTDTVVSVVGVEESVVTVRTEQNLAVPKLAEGNQIEINVTDTDLENSIQSNHKENTTSASNPEHGFADQEVMEGVLKQIVLESNKHVEQKSESVDELDEAEKIGELEEATRRDFVKKSVSVKEERSSSSESSRTSKSRTDSFNTDMTTSGVDSFDSGGIEFHSLSPIASTNSLNTIDVQMRHKEKKDSKEQVHHSTALRRLSNLTRVPSIRRQSSPGVPMMPGSKFFDFSENAIMYTTAKDAIGYATLRSLMKTRQISMDMESDYGLNKLYDTVGSTSSINRRPSMDSTEMSRPKR